ncbi:MAG: MGMT family protein [Planctomycetes bacterium]|nr:MGMT family protein [Planctomycetota bacterium]NBY01165.1 MGMT family protein [Planctomycetota bacterium]
MGEFFISSCFYKGFHFSIYWDTFYVQLLLAGAEDQTSRIDKLAFTFHNNQLIRKINKCNRLVALLDSLYAGEKVSVNPLPKGTPFQMKVWGKLIAIPYGQIKSYKQIATEIGNPKASRAVGNACGKNPILLLIPCHRVVASDGTLGGFSASFSLKKTLLDIEGVNLA